MKLVDISEFYAERGGGVRTYVNAKLSVGSAMGHEVVIVAPGDADREEPRLGGRIVWVRSPRLILDPRYRVLLRQRAVHDILARERADVIEGSSPWAGGLFVGRFNGPGLKSFVFHQDVVAVYPQTMFGRRFGEARVDRLCAGYFGYLRRLSSRYDLTVTGGAWLAERLARLGIPRTVAMPLGVEKGVFSPTLTDAKTRRDLLASCGLPETADLLVTVSRHHPEKRLFTLIDAVERLGRERPIGLAIFGDGPMRPLVARRAARSAHIYLAGRTKDRTALARSLASADALIHGSSAETFGLSVAEALCSGLPVVVPDRGGAAELAGPAYAERYPAGDAGACSDAIRRLLLRDRARLRAAAALAGVEIVLSTHEHFERLFALYEERIRTRSTSKAPARP